MCSYLTDKDDVEMLVRLEGQLRNEDFRFTESSVEGTKTINWEGGGGGGVIMIGGYSPKEFFLFLKASTRYFTHYDSSFSKNIREPPHTMLIILSHSCSLVLRITNILCSCMITGTCMCILIKVIVVILGSC